MIRYFPKTILSFCWIVIFYGLFANVINPDDYLDIPVADFLYPEKSIGECKGFNISSSSNETILVNNNNSYDTFKCINLFMNYYQWKAIESYPKIVNLSKHNCLNHNNEAFNVGVVKKQTLDSNKSFTYECKIKNKIKYWEVISNEI